MRHLQIVEKVVQGMDYHVQSYVIAVQELIVVVQKTLIPENMPH